MVHCRGRRRTSLCTSTRAIHGPHTSPQRTTLSRSYKALEQVGATCVLGECVALQASAFLYNASAISIFHSGA